MSRSTICAVVALAAALTACSDPDNGTGDAKPTTPSDITCPSGEVGASPGGEYPLEAQPEGAPTREKGAKEWVDGAYPGAEYIVVQQGVWVLREDGTAFARGDFLAGIDGYFVSASRACIE